MRGGDKKEEIIKEILPVIREAIGSEKWDGETFKSQLVKKYFETDCDELADNSIKCLSDVLIAKPVIGRNKIIKKCIIIDKEDKKYLLFVNKYKKGNEQYQMKYNDIENLIKNINKNENTEFNPSGLKGEFGYLTTNVQNSYGLVVLLNGTTDFGNYDFSRQYHFERSELEEQQEESYKDMDAPNVWRYEGSPQGPNTRFRGEDDDDDDDDPDLILPSEGGKYRRRARTNKRRKNKRKSKKVVKKKYF